MNDLVYIARRNRSPPKTKTQNYQAIKRNTTNTFNFEKKLSNFSSVRKDKPHLGSHFKPSDDLFRKSQFEQTFWNGNINISNISLLPIQQKKSMNMKYFKQNIKEQEIIPAKPSTANYIKRPKEKLRKGQNQLIYERLLEKININKKTSCNLRFT
jgi:hypothetical protein